MEQHIPQYYVFNDRIGTGAQPAAEGIGLIREADYDAILNLSPVSTPNYLRQEADLSARAGLEYIHYPVDCTRLESSHYLGFSRIMEGLKDRKVFVHCGGNIKSSNLVHMYQVLEMGIDESVSHRQLREVQEPEEKWYDYFRSFGMQGIQQVSEVL